jgi:hypothetical protein
MRASLSVHDLLNVDGASGREGLQRTAPRCEKCERPRIIEAEGIITGSVLSELNDTIDAGVVQGVASSCLSITSSILASPHGASEQYMKMLTSSLIVKGWNSVFVRSSCDLGRMYWAGWWGEVRLRRHWSSRKRLRARRARISACQSWRTLPWARGSLLEGRHFMPVL